MVAPEHNSVRWQKLKDIFAEAVELAPESRAAYLSGLRVNEKTLSEELAELVAAEEESENFLKKPLEINFDLLFAQTFIGAQIGNYKIQREIGRGGMGAVFEATRQGGEFEQKVAVKLTDNSFLSDEFRRRFNNERQILAALAHPNIVRLFDGGILPNRTPYFVMEYVEGVSLSRFCRENEVDLEAKLDIFLQVCAAVAYAHQQLIVHRDLKPSNILVTKNRQVKLLDFGIAKTLSSDIQTQTANAPHTPAYASPEQIKGEITTTLSDVYSLGIILYELLTEKTPAQIYQTSELGLPQAICETDPKPPSGAASLKSEVQGSKSENQKTIDEGQPTNNENLKTKTQNLKLLRGDLDNIVLKALSKEKEQRYASVERFAEDIKNYLGGLPVKAHPQSFVYRARKFVKRNHLAVSLGALAILLIIGGIAAAIWQSFEAGRQQQIAEQRFDQVRKIANSLIFDYHDEIAKLEGSTKLREKLVVDAVGYLDAIAQNSENNPELAKEIAVAYRKIGDVQGIPYEANLGKLDEAVKNYKNSVALLEKAVQSNQSDASLKDELIKSYKSLAYGEMRSENKQQAKLDLNKAVAISESAVQSDDSNLERKLVFFRLQIALGDMREDNPNPDVYENVLEGLNNLNASHPDSPQIALLLAIVHQRIESLMRWSGEAEERKNNFQAAREFYMRAVEHDYQNLEYEKLASSLRSKSTNERELVASHINLASSLNAVGQTDEAIKSLEISEKLVKNLMANDKHNRELVTDELGVYNVRQKILIRQGRFNAALETIKIALEIARDTYRNDSTNAEIINWIGHFSKEASNLLTKQKKEHEAGIYLDLYNDYARQYKEKFGKEWTGTFGF